MTTSQLYFSIHSIWERDKIFPSLEKISKETGVKIPVIREALQYYLTKGKLNQVNGNYIFPKSSKKQNIMILILRIIMGLVGFGCIITSIKFTYSFNKLNMPRLWAFILSSSLIIFTSFCFTVREVLKKTNKFQSNLFMLFYIIGIFYSIFTAISGQYNDYLINNNEIIENKIEDKTNDVKYQILLEKKNRYIEQIENYQNQLKAQQKIIDNLSESPERKFEFNNTWKQSNNLINEIGIKIIKLEDEISNIDSQLISSVNNEYNRTVFDLISDLFGIPSDLLQFIISLFPAIFIDLVSPFAISFCFYKK